MTLCIVRIHDLMQPKYCKWSYDKRYEKGEKEEKEKKIYAFYCREKPKHVTRKK